MINIIANKYIFLTISGLLVLAAVAAIITFGLKQGIDFTGGAQWQISTSTGFDQLQKLYPEATIISQTRSDNFIIRAKEINRELAKDITLEELSYEEIGPAIGSELRRKAIWAFVGVLLAISLYIAFAFRKVSQPVSSWKYGLITLVTLFHDALIPVGLWAYLGQVQNLEVSANLVVAILVVMGFSVHDTIVVFDRIRENLRTDQQLKSDFNNIVNQSVNQTLGRSLNTSLTLILVLLTLLFFGPANLTYFVLTILVGVVVGTYSSIFVASPLLTLWRRTAA
jgi:preprotein translocase subunit SecF